MLNQQNRLTHQEEHKGHSLSKSKRIFSSTVSPVPPAYLNRKNAAVYLGITTRFLDILKDRGEIPFYKPSSKVVLFKIVDLDRFMAEHKIEVEEYDPLQKSERIYA